MSDNHQPDDSSHLSIQAIAAACGCPYALARRYARAAGMADLMGAVPVQGALGPRYPLASLARWRTIIELHNAHVITPTTAAQALPILWGVEPLEGNPNVQTAESLKPMGRPPGKNRNPNYRQVTVYLPIDLHKYGEKRSDEFTAEW